MRPATPFPGQHMIALLDQLRQGCQDLTGQSIRASAESSQWRTRLAIIPGSPVVTHDLTAAYHHHATQDADHWRRLRHQWACRYTTAAVNVLHVALAATTPNPRPGPTADDRNWATATPSTCPPLPDPADLTTGVPADDARIAQAHQAVTESADAARILNDLHDQNTHTEITQAAAQLTDHLITYATAIHTAARTHLTPPTPGFHL